MDVLHAYIPVSSMLHSMTELYDTGLHVYFLLETSCHFTLLCCCKTDGARTQRGPDALQGLDAAERSPFVGKLGLMESIDGHDGIPCPGAVMDPGISIDLSIDGPNGNPSARWKCRRCK